MTIDGSTMGFPCGSAGKESAWNVGDLGSIPGLGRSPGEGKGFPVFHPGEFQGLYRSRDRKELDTTEWLSLFIDGSFTRIECTFPEHITIGDTE